MKTHQKSLLPNHNIPITWIKKFEPTNKRSQIQIRVQKLQSRIKKIDINNIFFDRVLPIIMGITMIISFLLIMTEMGIPLKELFNLQDGRNAHKH